MSAERHKEMTSQLPDEHHSRRTLRLDRGGARACRWRLPTTASVKSQPRIPIRPFVSTNG